MGEWKFHYYVKGETGHAEMEIFSEDCITFTIHFPRYEAVVPGSTQMEFRRSQIGMLLFAYDEQEFWRFSAKLMEVLL